jgi:hypothetical protein
MQSCKQNSALADFIHVVCWGLPILNYQGLWSLHLLDYAAFTFSPTYFFYFLFTSITGIKILLATWIAESAS